MTDRLVPTDELPLHPDHVAAQWLDEPWWACHQPERPRDDSTAYDVRCHRCLLAAEAHLHVQGDLVTGYFTPEGPGHREMASTLLQRAKVAHGL